MKYLILISLMAVSLPLFASTFVGNGGNAGDMEREVSRQQVLGAFQAISKNESTDASLCQCQPQYQNNHLCESLKKLNDDQRRFCARTLKVLSPLALQALNSPQVYYTWTNQSIQVKEGASLRAVDAVTDPSLKKITIHLEKFLDMNDSQRVFLLGHEVFHLLKHQEHYLGDTGDIGPFTGPNGGRELLNAMSASVVMASYQAKLFKKYENTLDRPKPWKKHRIELGATGVSVAENGPSDNAYINDSMGGWHLMYRYQTASPWGFSLAAKQYQEEKTLLTRTNATEELVGGGAGVSYRLFPFDDPLSFLGQSHLLFDFQMEFYEATYKVSDGTVEFSETDTALGASLDCKYYMPLAINIWLYLGLGAGYLEYEFKTFGVKYDAIRTQATIGASYGF